MAPLITQGTRITRKAHPGEGLVEQSLIDQVFEEIDRKPAKIKLRQPRPKQSKPGNWKDNEVIGSKTSEEKLKLLEAALPGPLDEKLAAAFRTSRPLEDRPSLVQCKHCRRPVEQSAAANHIRACLDKKQFKLKKKKEAKEAKDAAARRERGEKVSDGGDDDGSEKGRDGKGGDDGDGRKGKKRKVNGEAEKTSKTKKKKDEPKSKPTKVKGPVDVERQCGVLLPNGQQCARSLTCKSHSMGAKRAVPGRSKPYDLLLAAYQKQNQAKQQRAAIDANAPLQDDFELANGPVDSEEERDAVMAAISRANPQPLATKTFVLSRTKYQYVRMKEMLHNALGGSRGSGLFSTTNTVIRTADHQSQHNGSNFPSTHTFDITNSSNTLSNSDIHASNGNNATAPNTQSNPNPDNTIRSAVSTSQNDLFDFPSPLNSAGLAPGYSHNNNNNDNNNNNSANQNTTTTNHNRNKNTIPNTNNVDTSADTNITTANHPPSTDSAVPISRQPTTAGTTGTAGTGTDSTAATKLKQTMSKHQCGGSAGGVGASTQKSPALGTTATTTGTSASSVAAVASRKASASGISVSG